MEEIAKIIIKTSRPTFVIAYDYIARSIRAHFSMPYPEKISALEQNTINLIAERFTKMSEQYLNTEINDKVCDIIRAQIYNILKSAEYETGVKFELDDHNFVFRSPSY